MGVEGPTGAESHLNSPSTRRSESLGVCLRHIDGREFDPLKVLINKPEDIKPFAVSEFTAARRPYLVFVECVKHRHSLLPVFCVLVL